MTDRIAMYLAAALLVLSVPVELRAATHPPLATRTGVVASDNAQASEVGATILREGGNAVDAAIGTALALGVVNPSSSGIGGGGFAVIYIASEKKVYIVDFRETAPKSLSPQSFIKGGKLQPQLSRSGGLAVGIPGEVAGLEHMSKKFGALPWTRVVMPSEELARDGFVASTFFARAAEIVSKRLPPTHRFRGWLRPGGAAMTPHTRVRRSGLARTLKEVRTRGAAGFYTGWVAKDIVQAVKSGGGVLTMEDLAGYKVVERQPLTGRFGEHKIATMPLPSSGGLVLLEMLGILDKTGKDLGSLGAGSSAAIHLMAEVLKHGFADRARFLGDVKSPDKMMSVLLDPKRIARLAKRVSSKRVQPHGSYGDKNLGRATGTRPDAGTSHLCAVDRHGNAVALTTTVNGYFGAKLVTGKGGIVLNNQIDDFSIQSGRANMFGLVQSDANLVAPGKRPLSSMTPMLMFKDDKVVGCFGGSGGPRIIASTFQALLNVFVFGMNVREAVSAPRIHHQWLPNKLYMEKEIPRDVVRALKRRGQVTEPTRSISAVQAIVVREDGTREAASDPRKGGQPAAE